MRNIVDQWASYEEHVVPKNAGKTQRTEMRRAFYAGASVMLTIAMQIAADDLSDDAGAAVLEGVQDELRRFSVEVEAGNA